MNRLLERIKLHLNKNSFFYKLCRRVYLSFYKAFSAYGYIRQYVFFPIEAFGRKHHLWPFYDENAKILESLKDIHKGKRCFIIATGPSLRLEDVEKLESEITIGVNSLYRLFDKTQFRPTYYTVLDTDVQKIVEENIDKYERLFKKYIFMNPIRKFNHKDINYIPLCYQNHWFNLGNEKFDYSKNLKYNTDLLWGFYDKYTITNTAIELAIYMGCRDIYLIGVDCNYTGPKIYFDDTDNSPKMSHNIAYHTQKAMMTGYRYMEKETKARGIHIFNATRGGMLEEFDRVDFDSLF